MPVVDALRARSITEPFPVQEMRRITASLGLEDGLGQPQRPTHRTNPGTGRRRNRNRRRPGKATA